jgi:hypothetical protein
VRTAGWDRSRGAGAGSAGVDSVHAARHAALRPSDASTPYPLLAAALMLRGLGIGVSLTNARTAAYATLVRGMGVARGTSAINTIQRLGGALGVALMSVGLQRHLGRVRCERRRHIVRPGRGCGRLPCGLRMDPRPGGARPPAAFLPASRPRPNSSVQQPEGHRDRPARDLLRRRRPRAEHAGQAPRARGLADARRRRRASRSGPRVRPDRTHGPRGPGRRHYRDRKPGGWRDMAARRAPVEVPLTALPSG